MPGLDGTGPRNQGPMTGRGFGNCQENNKQEGFGRGMGMGRGRGFGRRNCWRSPSNPNQPTDNS